MQTRTNDEGFISQKGMGYKTITDQALADKVKLLDHRPWKSLDDQTPYEVYRQAWNGALAIRIAPFMVAGGIHA